MESETEFPVKPMESFEDLEIDRLLAAYEQGRCDAEAEFRRLFDSFARSLPPKVKKDRGYRAAEKWMATVKSRLAVRQALLKQRSKRNKNARSEDVVARQASSSAPKDKETKPIQEKVWCWRCKLPHPKSKCYRLNRACFRCGSKEHSVKDCSILAPMPSKDNQTTGEGTSHESRPLQPGHQDNRLKGRTTANILNAINELGMSF